MTQSYYNLPNRGIVIGSAFGNSIMESYNKALFMQADIQRFKSQERRYKEATAFREEGRERSDFLTYSNLVKQDIANSLFSDTAGQRLAPEYKRRFIDRIGGPVNETITETTPDPDFVGPPKPSALTRIGKARFQATTFKGEPAYEDTKTGTKYKRNPFKAGISGIGTKFKSDVPGIPSKSDAQAEKDIKTATTTYTDKAVKDAAIDRLRVNESPVAKEFLKNNEIDSLRKILKRFPQETDIPGAIFDESRSPSDVEAGIKEYIDSLIDIGYTPAEALAIAEEEYQQLSAEEFPRGTPLPITERNLTRQAPVNAQSDPLGIR